MAESRSQQSDTPDGGRKTPGWLRWQRRYVSENVFSFFICGIIGLLCGMASFALKWLIDNMSRFFTSGFTDVWPDWALILIPIVGIFLTGMVCRYWLHYTPVHGTRRIMQSLTSGNYDMPRSLMWSSVLTSTITLGFGGSAGAEGPIAYTGAAIGSNMGRAMHFEPQLMRVMIGCGAGAGIAGIFKAPIGGAFFTIEVLRMELSSPALMSLFVCALIAALTAYCLSGFVLNVQMDVSAPMDVSWLPWVMALGVFCGLYSLYYSWINHSLGAWLGRFANPWVKNLAGGAVLAISVFLLPELYGEGYGLIGDIINGRSAELQVGSIVDGMKGTGALILAAGQILLAKCFAASATNNSGGVAGEFAPTLFAGCLAGYFFAVCANVLFGAGISAAHFALFGMAGVMAGVIRAPFMAIFLTCEMTGAFTYFLPVTIAAALSFGVTRLYTFDRFYMANKVNFNGMLSFFKRTGKNT